MRYHSQQRSCVNSGEDDDAMVEEGRGRDGNIQRDEETSSSVSPIQGDRVEPQRISFKDLTRLPVSTARPRLLQGSIHRCAPTATCSRGRSQRLIEDLHEPWNVSASANAVVNANTGRAY